MASIAYDGRADQGGVLRLPETHRRSVLTASHGPVMARTMSTMLRLSAVSRPIMLHQTQSALLQTRLRTVRLSLTVSEYSVLQVLVMTVSSALLNFNITHVPQ